MDNQGLINYDRILYYIRTVANLIISIYHKCKNGNTDSVVNDLKATNIISSKINDNIGKAS